MSYLLDANVVIALAVAEHEHHSQASSFALAAPQFAVCPIVEGALVRFLVRMGETPAVAAHFFRELRRSAHCEFWPDDLSYVDVPLDHVHGHRQVTDAYLAALARAHNARVATFDNGFAQAFPDAVALIALGD